MKQRLFVITLALVGMTVQASGENGRFIIRTIARNAVRIQYVPSPHSAVTSPSSSLPDWIYVKQEQVESDLIRVSVDEKTVEKVGTVLLIH